MSLPSDRSGATDSESRDTPCSVPTQQSRIAVDQLTAGEILRKPLPALVLVDRLLVRAIAFFARRQVRAIYGLENLLAARDPLILALNHSTRRETVLVTGILIFYRGGRLIHIWTNWIYLMIPGVGWILRRGGMIIVAAKPPRLKFLSRFKRFYVKPKPAMEQARDLLLAGRTVGVFPEGRLSADPRRLLPGRMGMARLSLETGVPIVPVGIRFPGADRDKPIPEDAAMEVYIGPPLLPADAGAKPTPAAVREWHATIMTEIARLSCKTWQPRGAESPSVSMPGED
jgi:1-acyl-sn-glycerol-3-phosphate acyltransferase